MFMATVFCSQKLETIRLSTRKQMEKQFSGTGWQYKRTENNVAESKNNTLKETRHMKLDSSISMKL